jgi:hypothetical protein
MYIYKTTKSYLYSIDEIFKANSKRFSRCQSFMIYRNIIDVLKYWRHCQEHHFEKLTDDQQDEIAYWFTERLLVMLDNTIDIYWLIADIDGEPLYKDHREVNPFWRKMMRKKYLSRIYI